MPAACIEEIAAFLKQDKNLDHVFAMVVGQYQTDLSVKEAHDGLCDIDIERMLESMARIVARHGCTLMGYMFKLKNDDLRNMDGCIMRRNAVHAHSAYYTLSSWADHESGIYKRRCDTNTVSILLLNK